MSAVVVSTIFNLFGIDSTFFLLDNFGCSFVTEKMKEGFFIQVI